MVMTHYLDNSATTKPSEASMRAAVEALELYGNPSSVHSEGVRSKHLLDASRAKIAETLGVKRINGGSVIFTSSGTEANCTAILGYSEAKNRFRSGKAPTVIISEGEHPSVENPTLRLKEKGWNVFRIPTRGGELDIDALRTFLATAENVVLAALMLVNNETGALYDVKRAASIIHTAFPECHVHCDAVQAFMKMKLSVSILGVDSMTVSAHKIHAPRGAAALWISADTVKKKNIIPILPGGGQEMGFRSGTENLVAISAFAAAAAEEKAGLAENIEKVEKLRGYLASSLDELAKEGVAVKRPASFVPHIVNITLPRIKSETMLNFLSGKGIFVSAGSACSASSGRLSHALRAFGCPDDVIDSSLRVSLSHTNTEADIDALCTALAEGVRTLARF